MVARAPVQPERPEYSGRGADIAPRRRSQHPRRRRHSRLRRLAAVLGVLLTILVLIGAALWVATPSVADARARTDALLRQHGATSIGNDVPTKLAAALIATEDSRFYSHSGLDARGALRGALSLSRGGALGGATLDAQLAKLLYTHGAPGLRATTKQVTLAVKLDARWSKRQILAMYLDAAYFGHGAYGVAAAADTYFGL